MHPYFLHDLAEAHWEALHRVTVTARRRPLPVRSRLGEAIVRLGQRVASTGTAPAHAPASSCC